MHFRITGTEHATSARRTIELDAPNRAAAEKQAHRQGLDIQHVERVIDDLVDDTTAAHAQRVTHRGEFPESSGRKKWIALLVVVTLLIVAAVVYWRW